MNVEQHTPSSSFNGCLPQESGNQSHSYGKLLNELSHWNEYGIHHVTRLGTGNEDDQSLPSTSKLSHGIAYFRKAFGIARSYCACKSNDAGTTEAMDTSSTTPSRVPFYVGIAEEEVIHHSYKNNLSEFIFKRPFKITGTVVEEDNYHPSPPTTVLPCAVVVFNLALMHHMLDTNKACPEAHRNHCLRQSVCLYQNCWDLIATMVKMMNERSSSNIHSNTSRWSMTSDNEMLELLSMAVLNNMSIALHELTDYESAKRLSSRLSLLISTSIHFRHQVDAPSPSPRPTPERPTNHHTMSDDDDGGNPAEQLVSMPILEAARWNFMLTAMVLSTTTTVAPSA